MNAILKFIAGLCIVTSLAMSGCIDSVTVDQNGTVTIDPADAATANVNVQTSPEAPVKNDTSADVKDTEEQKNSTGTEDKEQPVKEDNKSDNDTVNDTVEEEKDNVVDEEQKNNTDADNETDIEEDSNSTDANDNETVEESPVENVTLNNETVAEATENVEDTENTTESNASV